MLQDLSRRALLGAAAAAATMIVTGANAGAIPKTAVTYQDNPKDGHQCSGCKLFVAGRERGRAGHLQVRGGRNQPQGLVQVVRRQGGAERNRLLRAPSAEPI